MLGCRLGIIDSQEKPSANTTDFRWAANTTLSTNNTMFQDVASTVPVTATGQTVRSWISYDDSSKKFIENTGAKQIRYTTGVGSKPCIEINSTTSSSADFSSLFTNYNIPRVNISFVFAFSNNGTASDAGNGWIMSWGNTLDNNNDQTQWMQYGYGSYWYMQGTPANYDIAPICSAADVQDGTQIKVMGVQIVYNTSTKLLQIKMIKQGQTSLTTNFSQTYDLGTILANIPFSLNGPKVHNGSCGRGAMKIYAVEMYSRVLTQTEMVNRINAMASGI